jgi:GTP cyclohydrolase II
MTETSPTTSRQNALPLPASLQAVERAIADLRRGSVVILQGNGNALMVLAAEGATREGLARLRALAHNPPGLALTARRANLLGLTDNPAGTVRVSLGSDISAETVRQLADPLATVPTAAVQPLTIARIDPETDPGAAESGAITLVKLARLLPAALVAPVPRERLAYLSSWAATQDFLLVELEAVHDYRTVEARQLRRVAGARVPLAGAENTQIIAFRPPDGGHEHLAIVIGEPDPAEPVLVRLHSECFTGDLLGSLRCDCGDQLRGAVDAIAAAGSGVILYMAHEGRGIGLVNKLRAYALQDTGHDTIDANVQLGFDADERYYLPAAEMLRQLGYRRIRLLTNNPDKVAALSEWGIEVAERVPHRFPANPHNEAYLTAKQQRAGHIL